MQHKVKTAVFPVAGLGTRFLPATKSIPKEILSLVDRPLIQYAIDEARDAGIESFIFVTSRGKNALEDYFDASPGLEHALDAKGKTELRKIIDDVTMRSGEIVYVRQRDPKGLGHAVACAARLIGDQPFAVILPDDVIAGDVPCLKQMVDAYQTIGGNMVAAMQVTPEQTKNYGVLSVRKEMNDLFEVDGMVEKPQTNPPSNLAVIGRYILTPAVLRNLEQTQMGAGDEIQLTDAIAQEVQNSQNVYGFRFKGTRYDCGSKSGFLRATIAFALQRPDLRDDLMAFLQNVVQEES